MTIEVIEWSWVLWFIAFGVSIVLMLVGMYIYHVNVFKLTAEAYRRSKGKSFILFQSSKAIDRLQEGFSIGHKTLVIGGSIPDREGIVEVIRSYNKDTVPLIVLDNFEREEQDVFRNIMLYSSVSVIASVKYDIEWYYKFKDSLGVFENIVIIEPINKKWVAHMVVYVDGTWIDVSEYYKKQEEMVIDNG